MSFCVVASLAVLGAAATSWACTVMASFSLEAPAAKAGVPGTPVTVQGLRFLHGDVNVSLVGEDSPETPLWRGATKQDGSFVATFPIPLGTAPGDYSIVARTGNLEFQRSAAFLVTAPAGGSGDPGTPPAQNPGPQTAPPSGQDTAGPPAATAPAATAPTASAPANAVPVAAPAPVRTSQGQAAPSSGTPAADAVAQAAPATAVPATAEERAQAPEGPLARRSVTGDLWSGLTGGTRSLGGPGLTGTAPAPGGSGLAVGVGLLSVGLVGLGSVVAVAAVRRRRVTSASS